MSDYFELDRQLDQLLDAYMKYLFEMIRQEHELARELAPKHGKSAFITRMVAKLGWLRREDISVEGFLRVYYHPNRRKNI